MVMFKITECNRAGSHFNLSTDPPPTMEQTQENQTETTISPCESASGGLFHTQSVQICIQPGFLSSGLKAFLNLAGHKTRLEHWLRIQVGWK